MRDWLRGALDTAEGPRRAQRREWGLNRHLQDEEG